MIFNDGLKIILIISHCLVAGYLFGRWYEHRLYLEFMFGDISKMIGN